jgi:large subunit ribosomal protein L22
MSTGKDYSSLTEDELIARLEDYDAKLSEAEEQLEEGAEEEPVDQRPARRRTSAETTTEAARKAPPARADGELVVSARAKYVRTAPRKARLVMDHIRGKPVAQARAILQHAPRAVSTEILKLLESAVANAENNYELATDELRIGRAYVDEGPTIKRYRPRALGRATRINKRTSHMTIELTNLRPDVEAHHQNAGPDAPRRQPTGGR